MAMQLAALDILITKGGFAPESARAIGEAVDLEIERSRESLATGQQLTDTRLMLEGQLTDTRIKLEGQLTDTRVKLEQQITALEHKVGEFRLELLGKIESTKAEVLRWMFGAMTGQTVVLVALIRLLR
jgi:hypothetical protein